MSIQKNPDPRDIRYIQFVDNRLHGLSEMKIARKLELESPKAMYRQLSKDGYPICSECGTAPVTGTHCEPPVQKRQQRARKGGGEVQELPSASSAAWLFRAALRDFEDDIRTLADRRDYLQDERFVAQYVHRAEDGTSWTTHYRRDMPEAKWRQYYLDHGQDPDVNDLIKKDHFDIPTDSHQPGGVSWAPPEPLTRLIAMYVLSGLPVEALLRSLHPNSNDNDALPVESLNTEQLDQHINGKKHKTGKVPGLKTEAESVARLVRGGIIHPGRTTGELSPVEEEARDYIELRRQQGVPDKQVLQELREGYGLTRSDRFGDVYDGRTWPDISMSELQRLGKLGLGQRPEEA